MNTNLAELVAQLREQAPLVDRPAADELMRRAADELERLAARHSDTCEHSFQDVPTCVYCGAHAPN